MIIMAKELKFVFNENGIIVYDKMVKDFDEAKAIADVLVERSLKDDSVVFNTMSVLEQIEDEQEFRDIYGESEDILDEDLWWIEHYDPETGYSFDDYYTNAYL